MRTPDDITWTRTVLNDTPTWVCSDGTTLPVVSGGDGPDPDPDPDPEPTPNPAPDPDPDPDPAPTAEELAKWKALARKHEDRAKANASAAKELETLRAASMSDTEKAVAEAEQRGRQAATAEHVQQLAGARIEAALTGIVPDPAAVVEDLNLLKYVTDTGDVDGDAIETLRTKYAELAAGTNSNGNGDGPKPKPDLKQGNRGRSGGGKPQLTRADLAGMSPDAIEQARLDGRLDDILGIKT